MDATKKILSDITVHMKYAIDSETIWVEERTGLN